MPSPTPLTDSIPQLYAAHHLLGQTSILHRSDGGLHVVVDPNEEHAQIVAVKEQVLSAGIRFVRWRAGVAYAAGIKEVAPVWSEPVRTVGRWRDEAVSSF